MKHKILLFPLAVGAIFAQQGAPVTATSTFYDVTDVNDRAFVDFSKNATKKLTEALMKEDSAIRTVSLSVRMYGGNPAPPGRYRFSIIRDGYPSASQAGRLAALSQKATGMSYDDYIKKAASLRKTTGGALRQRVATTSGDKPVGLAEGDIVRIDLMKISAGRAADYYNYERNDWLPMHTQRAKEGKIKGWSSWSVLSPSGSERQADALTTTIYKDLASAMSNPQYQSLYTKLFPDRSVAAWSDRGRTLRTLVRGDVWRVVWAVSRQ